MPQPQTVGGYTMGYFGLKKSSGNTNMIAMLTVTVCIKLQWAQQQAHPLWAVQHHSFRFKKVRNFQIFLGWDWII